MSSPAVKLCAHCSDPLDNRKLKYHKACKPLAIEAARLAMRKCKRCKKVKAASSFSNDSTRPDGKFPWCMECQGSYAVEKKFQSSDDELNGHVCSVCDTPCRGHANRRFCSASCKDRARSLRAKYGLTVEDYRRLIEDAAGRCPICTKRVRQWHVDHNHRTLKTTGVVCNNCNVGPLAMTYHDVEMVRRLLAFLEHTPADRLGIEAMAPVGVTRPSNLHSVWRRAGRRRV